MFVSVERYTYTRILSYMYIATYMYMHVMAKTG